MSDMTDDEYAQAMSLCETLYRYLDKHGGDGDEFVRVYRALDGISDRFEKAKGE